MKKVKFIFLSALILIIGAVTSAFAIKTLSHQNPERVNVQENVEKQTISLFVTHGHCSTPFTGNVENLEVSVPVRKDGGNPIEGMEMSFEINPDTFNVCAGDHLTQRIKTPDLFIGENDENIIFKSTDVYTMGVDWYQVNGKLSIKGVENDVKFYVSGIRKSEQSMPNTIVLDGQLNLFNWEIDYDKIVNGESADVPTQWMHLNMKVDIKDI